MSHGGDDSIEPDLTPLLDLVMQLLMFFIINVSFTQAKTDADTDLPKAGSARPEPDDKNAIFLDLRTLKGVRGAVNRNNLPEFLEGVNDQGVVIKTNVRNTMKFQDAYVKYAAARLPLDLYKTQLETKGWLLDKYKAIKREGTAVQDGKVTATVHIRPDGDLELNQLFMLMQSCKVAGFRNIKVHAFIGE